MTINWVKFYDKRCKIRSKIMLIFLQILLCFNLLRNDSIKRLKFRIPRRYCDVILSFSARVVHTFSSSLMRWILIRFLMEIFIKSRTLPSEKHQSLEIFIALIPFLLLKNVSLIFHSLRKGIKILWAHLNEKLVTFTRIVFINVLIS